MKTIRAARLLRLLTMQDSVELQLVPGTVKRLFACFSLVLLVGCAATPPKPGIVSDGKIKNSSIGFNGYEVTIPAGYRVFIPGTSDAEDTPFIAGLKTDFSTNSQFVSARAEISLTERREFMESFLLTSHETAVLFAANTYTIPFAFSRIPERDRYGFLQNVVILTPTLGPPAKSIIKLGDRHVLKVTSQGQLASDPSKTLFQTDMYFVLGNLNEEFRIGSLAPKEKAADMIPILNRMAASLKL